MAQMRARMKEILPCGRAMSYLLLFCLWLGLSLLVGLFAERRKARSGPGFFFLSLLLSPLLGIAIALLVASNKDQDLLDIRRARLIVITRAISQ
jgi:hypothetical protein